MVQRCLGGSAGSSFNYGIIDSLVSQGLGSGSSAATGSGTGSGNNNAPTEFNLFETSIGGGYGYTRNINTTRDMLTDMNGDGLPDRVYREGDVLVVQYNTGCAFGPSEVLLSNRESPYATLSSVSNLSGTVSGGFSLGMFPIKFVINPQGGGGRSMSKVESQLLDMNADGFPDYVTSGEIDKLRVRYNQLGKVNRLKSVTNCVEGKMTLDYALSQNSMECPQRTWTMSSLTVFDGHIGDGVDEQRFVFSYDSAYYERFERESFGFKKVITKQLDENQSVYRTITEKYHTDDHMRKGLKYYELLSNGAGNKYVEKFYQYALKEIATGRVINTERAFCYGEGYPALNEELVKYYEGDATAQIITRKTYEHGAFGNVTAYVNDYDTTSRNDDVKTQIRYYPDSSQNYLVGIPVSVSVYDQSGERLRYRESEVDSTTGQIKRLRIDNGNGFSEYDYVYDTYGNISEMTLPANQNSERVVYRYQYDPSVRSYVVRTENVSLGYYSTATYSYVWGKPLTVTDLNGQVMQYSYDSRGRYSEIKAPG
ncbi:MAG: toxin TcdB middle/N-terminal domain-containing protein, partial [Bacteroidales bacterium]